jgi:hypothetical protein
MMLTLVSWGIPTNYFIINTHPRGNTRFHLKVLCMRGSLRKLKFPIISKFNYHINSLKNREPCLKLANSVLKDKLFFAGLQMQLTLKDGGFE